MIKYWYDIIRSNNTLHLIVEEDQKIEEIRSK